MAVFELGRYFPIRSDFDVVFEATLDGKALQSDPVRHKATIHVENELVEQPEQPFLLKPYLSLSTGMGDNQESAAAPPLTAYTH
jgi:hypothetical protein